MSLTHAWSNSTDPVIPEISDEQLFKLSKQFTLLIPTKQGYNKVLVEANNKELRETSCIWDPKVSNERVQIGAKIERVPFYVTCGYYGFFKPSIAEVLSQTPTTQLLEEGFNAFYIEDDIEILTSGSFQRATAAFVTMEK